MWTPGLAQHGGQGSGLSFPAQHSVAPQTSNPALIPLCLIRDLTLCLSCPSPFHRGWSLFLRLPTAALGPWTVGHSVGLASTTPAPFPLVLGLCPFPGVWLWP